MTGSLNLIVWMYVMGCLLALMYADEFGSKRVMGVILFMAAWPVLVPIIFVLAIVKTAIDAVRS